MKVKSIKVNAVLNIIYTISNIIFPLITFPYVSRILLADGMGKVSFFSSIATYATLFASLGISTYGIRAVAKVREDKKELTKVVYELLIITTISTLIVLFIFILLVFHIEKFRKEPLLVIINCLSILTACIGMNWLYSGLEQYEYITKRSIIIKFISLIFVFIFVRKKQDYILYAAIMAFSTIATYICNFYYSSRLINWKKPNNLSLRRHFKPMLLLFASILAVSIYTNLDTVMLGLISDDKQVGLYTVAVKVKWLLLNVINAISTVLLPRLSYYIKNSNFKDYNLILKKSISIIILISLPLSIFFIINAKESILLLGGRDYLDSVACMRIIMPILLISGFSNIAGNQVLIPMGKDMCFMIAVVIGAVVDFILNLLLMPKYGCVGAAISTLMAEIAQMSIQFIFAYKYINRNTNSKTLIRIVVATIIASIITIFIKAVIGNGIIRVLTITSIVYFTLYLIILNAFKEPIILDYKKLLLKKLDIINSI